MKLTSREVKLLKYLLNSRDYLSIKEISLNQHINERSVRYSLEKIDLFLVENQLPILTRVKRKGVLLPKSEKLEELILSLQTKVDSSKFQYTHDEIFSFILLSLLISNESLPSSYFEDILFISRTSVINTISELDGILFLEDLELVHKKREGFALTGSIQDKSRVASEFLMKKVSYKEMDLFIETGETKTKISELLLNTIFNIDEMQLIKETLHTFESRINCQIDVDLYSYYLILSYKLLTNSELKKNYDLDYVKDRLMNRLMTNFNNSEFEINKKNIERAVFLMIDSLEGVFGMRISQSEDFLNPLYRHLELMIIRRLNNINVINPIHDQILEKYEWIYEVIASCQTKLEALLNVKLTAHDLSFLVVYFVGEINAKMDKENNTKVLIVYETRKSITNLISKQIKDTFYFESVDKVSVRDLDALDLNGYTLIISETRVDNIPKEKFLKVNSYLTKQDLLKISQRLKLSFVEKSYGGINHFSNVIKIIKKNTIIQDLSGLELELINELKRVEINEVKEQPLMIEPDLVKVFSHETHWEKAIKESTTLLYQKGYIEKRYEDRIIENIRRIGPYMIISPGIMLAHAGPQDGVLKDGLSITYFKKGIFFNARQEVGVNLIFTVALIEEKNRFLIEKIAKLATNNNLIEQVRLTNSTEDLHKFLSGLLEG